MNQLHSKKMLNIENWNKTINYFLTRPYNYEHKTLFTIFSSRIFTCEQQLQQPNISLLILLQKFRLCP